MADLSAKVTGRLISVAVDEGDIVRAGQVVARLDDTEVRADVARAIATRDQARAAVSAETASLARARALLTASEAEVRKARSARDLAVKDANRWRRLQEQGVVALADRDLRETEATAAGEALAAAKANRDAARQAVAAALASQEMAARNVAATLATVDAARSRQSDTTIVSPFDGYVVKRLVEPGTTVSPGLRVLTVADPSTAWVTIYLNERETGALSPEDPAEIRLRSEPGRAIPGHVARLRHESDRVTEQLAVDIAIDERPMRLVLGEQAEATVSAAPKRAALAVPLSAVVRTSGGTAVLVVVDGRLDSRAVRLGAVDPSGWAEVVEGLEEGDPVVLAPGRLAEAGNMGRRVRSVVAGGAAPGAAPEP